MVSWKKWLSTGLIIAGLGIAAFPIADKLYADYWQNKLLEAYDSQLTLNEEADQQAEADFLALQAIYEASDAIEASEEETTVETSTDVIESTVASSEATTEKAKTVDKSVIGKIKISKINLIMPILMGATDKNLNRGAAVIAGTSDFGEIGNVGIAGHRGRSYGLFFNRLDELGKGDIIEISTDNKVYKYTVYETLIVEPTEISVLYKNNEDKILTLVTCDPVKNPTHRLIIHALQNP